MRPARTEVRDPERSFALAACESRSSWWVVTWKREQEKDWMSHFGLAAEDTTGTDHILNLLGNIVDTKGQL